MRAPSPSRQDAATATTPGWPHGQTGRPLTHCATQQARGFAPEITHSLRAGALFLPDLRLTMKSTAYYALAGKDLGALLVIEDGAVPILFLFGSGFDGADYRLMCTAKPNQAGYDVRKVNAAIVAGTEFPPPAQDLSDPIGSCALIDRTADSVTLSLSVDRYALGYPEVDFSPAPPRDVTGTYTLHRLA